MSRKSSTIEKWMGQESTTLYARTTSNIEDRKTGRAGITETKRKHQGRAMLQHTISKNSGAAGTAGPMERNQQNANTKSSTPFAARRHPRKRAAAGAAEPGPMETTKRRHRTSATVPHTISRNNATSAAELGPMKQRHTETEQRTSKSTRKGKRSPKNGDS
ncbi:hypothetical protein ARMGADRAFT_1057421 [Armillaria gallica]|uniref:Uncharacterized protein n=1 Tax=Armillaria gallica TaxID=47427 RepID=A0A2H3ESU8_ARMGA|nr:hypothetical protein ARMGADRAFT_1057421 [Armillaria gallica]